MQVAGGGSGSPYVAPGALDAGAKHRSKLLAYEAERTTLKEKLSHPFQYRSLSPVLTDSGPSAAPVDKATRQRDQDRLDFLDKELAGTPNIATLYANQTKLDKKTAELSDARAELKSKTDARDKAFPHGRQNVKVDTSSVASIYDSAPAAMSAYNYDQVNKGVTEAQRKVDGLTSDVQGLTRTLSTAQPEALTGAVCAVPESDVAATPPPPAHPSADEFAKPGAHDQSAKKPGEAGSVHTVKPGDTLWEVSRSALKAQGVAHPDDAQVAAGVKVISDTNRGDSSKRSQFPDVKVDDAHRIGKNPDLIHPGETVVVPDLSQVIYPGKTFKWDPLQNKLVAPAE